MMTVAACALWVLLRLAVDQLAWFRRDTTLVSLTEGEYRVVHVLDWRTLVVVPLADGSAAGSGSLPVIESPWRARVSLIGVSGPSPSPPRRRHESADRFTRDFLAGQSVHLRLDRRRVDREGVFLAYVFVGQRMLNEELVRAGWACPDPQPGDSGPLVRRLRDAESETRLRHPSR